MTGPLSKLGWEDLRHAKAAFSKQRTPRTAIRNPNLSGRMATFPSSVIGDQNLGELCYCGVVSSSESIGRAAAE
jgi:hypothetical protein